MHDGVNAFNTLHQLCRQMDLRVGGKYVLRKRLGAGSFGEIYSGEHIISHEHVAIKLEQKDARPAQLHNESRTYKILSGGVGIPSVKWFGLEGDYNVMVMDLLGKSIEDLFVQRQRNFSLKTVLMIADQMISRIEYIHSKNLLHRDIKPDNFVFGAGEDNSNLLYVIDFGLAKRYRDPKTRQHIPFREGKSLTGTARYTSINTHLGIEQSRRDDMEGIAYVLIYLLKGSLPWMGLKVENKKQKYEAIAEKKIAIPVDVVCQGLPSEFATFLTEVRRLDFPDRPDYAFYRQMFRDLFIREGYVYDYKYDWSERPKVEPVPLVFDDRMSHVVIREPEREIEQPVKSTRHGYSLADVQRINPSAPVLPIVQTPPLGRRALARPSPEPKTDQRPPPKPSYPRRIGILNIATPPNVRPSQRSAYGWR